MLSAGVAKKVTIHLNEDTTARHDFLYNEIFALLKGRGVAGATLIRTAAGFGTHHRLHSTEGGLAEKEHLPVRIEFIDSDRPLGNCAALAEVRVSCIRVNECQRCRSEFDGICRHPRPAPEPHHQLAGRPSMHLLRVVSSRGRFVIRERLESGRWDPRAAQGL